MRCGSGWSWATGWIGQRGRHTVNRQDERASSARLEIEPRRRGTQRGLEAAGAISGSSRRRWQAEARSRRGRRGLVQTRRGKADALREEDGGGWRHGDLEAGTMPETQGLVRSDEDDDEQNKTATGAGGSSSSLPCSMQEQTPAGFGALKTGTSGEEAPGRRQRHGLTRSSIGRPWLFPRQPTGRDVRRGKRERETGGRRNTGEGDGSCWLHC